MIQLRQRPFHIPCASHFRKRHFAFPRYKEISWASFTSRFSVLPQFLLSVFNKIDSVCHHILYHTIANTAVMNSFIVDPAVVEKIQNSPPIPAETFQILDGCEDPERDYDVPTGQTFSNGVSLCYTPKEPPRKSKKGRGRKRPPPEEEVPQFEGHRGLGVLDILPVSPQIIFTHGSGRDIYQKGFMHFVSGLARTHPVLAFRKDRGEAGSREEELYKRTAAFNYFFNDAYSSVRAMGGRSFGGRSAARASVYSTNKNLILWSYPLIRDSDWRKDELIALSEDTRVLFIKGEKDWVS